MSGSENEKEGVANEAVVQYDLASPSESDAKRSLWMRLVAAVLERVSAMHVHNIGVIGGQLRAEKVADDLEAVERLKRYADAQDQARRFVIGDLKRLELENEELKEQLSKIEAALLTIRSKGGDVQVIFGEAPTPRETMGKPGRNESAQARGMGPVTVHSSAASAEALRKAVLDVVELVNAHSGAASVRLEFNSEVEPKVDFIAHAAEFDDDKFTFTAGFETYSGTLDELEGIRAKLIEE